MLSLGRGSAVRTLWFLFAAYAVIVAAGQSGFFSGNVYNVVASYAPILLLMLYLYCRQQVGRGVALILIASMVGFAAEYISLRYGTIFGSNYTYSAGASILGVPYVVIFYWGIFVFLGYSLVNEYAFTLGTALPRKSSGGKASVWRFVMFDGLVVMALDLFMDPLYVYAGTWSWKQAGPYFGVPIGNFIGWFCVAAIATGIFRLLEYSFAYNCRNELSSLNFVPVLGYVLVGFVFLGQALSYRFYALATIGTIVVILPGMYCLYRLWKHRSTKSMSNGG